VKRPVALLIAFLLGCGRGRIVQHGEVNEDAVTQIRRTLPDIRGLSFTAPVPTLAMPPADIRATLAHEIDQNYSAADLEHLEAVYRHLGFLRTDQALRAALERIYEEEAAGFYDPREKRLVLASRALHSPGFLGLLSSITGRDLVGEFLVSHELTHALQDQHWGVPVTPDPMLDGHGDRLLARHALLEGDATLAGFAYVLRGDLDRDTISSIEHRLHTLSRDLASRYPDIPDVIRATLAFQYDEGTAFAGWALAAGGWPAVDAVEADPPDSTEQVLHPARYFATRERPRAIRLAGTESLEAAGWMRTLEDTLGELQLRVLGRHALSADRAASVADGWAGDRLRSLARGDALLLVWMTAWHSPDEAREFAAAMPAIAAAARVERREDRVLVLTSSAGSAVDLDTLARRVWGATDVASETASTSREPSHLSRHDVP
jgi:hypothetical protein